MATAVEEILPLAAVGTDPRIAAANELRKLVRQFGPECYRMAGTFAIQMNRALASYPAEAQSLAAALKYRAVDEIVGLRGSADPNTYLRTVALKLARESGIEQLDALWAVSTWHESLNVAPKGPTQMEFTDDMKAKKLWTRRKPAPAAIVMVTGFVIGVCSLVGGGTAEVINIRYQGPTFLEMMLVDKPKPGFQKQFVGDLEDEEGVTIQGIPFQKPSWESTRKYGPVGFLMIGTASFIGGFCGWSLGGGTWRRIAKGCLFAAGMSAAGTMIVVTTMNFGAVRILLSTPVVGSIVHLVLLGTMVFGVSYRVAVNDRTEEDVIDMMLGGMVGAIQNDIEFVEDMAK